VFRLVVKHEEHASAADLNRTIHALCGRQGRVKKLSRTQSAAFYTIYGSLDSTVANVLKAHFSGMQWPN
jgi:hypothetical protein